MKGLVLNASLACGAILALILVFVLFVSPAGRRVDEAKVQADLEATGAEKRIPQLASRPYEMGLKQAKTAAQTGLTRIREQLAGQEARLEAWFPRLELRSNGLPALDSFQSSYEFACDRLREYVREEVFRLARRRPEKVPLVQPLFEMQSRLPEAKELVPAQREFNVQDLVLRAAARGGAWPVEPLRIKPEWSDGDTSKKFRSTRVTAELHAVAARLPHLLRSLLELEGNGPIVRLSGVKTRPLPPPDKLGEDEPLLLDVQIDIEIVALVTRS